MHGLSAGPWETLFSELFRDGNASKFSYSLYVVGLFLIFLQCLLWIFGAVVTQHLFEAEEFDSPFLMTYVGVSLMAPLLPLKLFSDWWSQQKEPEPIVSKEILAAASFDSFVDDLHGSSLDCTGLHSFMMRRSQARKKETTRKWRHKRHFLAALLISPAMFAADWMLNNALSSTSIASATVLISVQNVVVYALAIGLQLESFSKLKVTGILLALMGTALTTLHDNDDQESLTGDGLALLAAVFYATYTVQVRLFCPDNEELYSMTLLLGYIGMISFVSLLPVALYLFIKTNVNFTWAGFGLVALKGVLDFAVADYLLFRAIVLTSATIATVGLGLTIPMAFVTDWAMDKEDVFTIHSCFGAAACAFGFLLVNMAPTCESCEDVTCDSDDISNSSDRNAHDYRNVV